MRSAPIIEKAVSIHGLDQPTPGNVARIRFGGIRGILRRFFLRSDDEDRAVTVAAVIAAGVMLTLLALPLFSGEVPAFGDLGDLLLPVRVFYAKCLQQGDSFDWMPQLFGGFFLTGEGEHGTYHPFHWLLYRFLPVPMAFQIEVFFPCVMLLIGMTFFLRRFVVFAAACVGALFFTFSVMYAGHLGHPQIAAIIAHIPWQLAVLQTAVTSADPRRRSLAGAAIAFLTGSQILLGHPQALWFSLFAESAFAVYLFFQYTRSMRVWIVVGAGKLLGFCIGAVQLWATLAYFPGTMRSNADLGFVFYGSLPPSSLVSLVTPCMLYQRIPGWSWIYFGAVPMVLAVWWLGCGMWQLNDNAHGMNLSRRDVKRLSLCVFGFVVVVLWMAFGVHGKLYYLQTLLPIVGKFRAPARYLTLMELGVVILSVFAFARLLCLAKTGRKLAWKQLALPWLIFLMSMVSAIWFSLDPTVQPTHNFQAELYAGPLLIGGAAIAMTLAARGRVIGLVLLVVLGAVDLGLYGIGSRNVAKYCWWDTTPYQDYLTNCAMPPSSQPSRVLDTSFCKDRLGMQGYSLINGYGGGLEPARQLDYRHVNSLRVANVSWYRDVWQPDFRVAGLSSPVKDGWRSVPNPLPRARLVAQAVPSQTPNETLKEINVDSTAVVSHEIELPVSIPGVVAVTKDRPGKISMNVTAPQKQLLVLSECYDAGWEVRVDGRCAPTEQVNGDFLGCVIEGGDHLVQFAFCPPSIRYGRMISMVGFGLGICWSFGSRRRGNLETLGRRCFAAK